MKVEQCRICHSKSLQLILDLGVTALANSFVKPGEVSADEPKFPLRLVLCSDCGLVQIDEEVAPEILFKDYIYVSGTSDLVYRHGDWLAHHFTQTYHMGVDDLIVEAASNDGTVLQAFKRKGVRTLGIEPAANIARRANEAGIETVCEFFNVATATQVRQKHGPAKLFMGRHVLAHVADLHGFVGGIKTVLGPDGVGVVEMPYLLHFFQNLEYDTVYHEHLCYFGVRVLRKLFSRFNLDIIDVREVEIHGGSIVVSLQHKGGPHTVAPVVDAMIKREEALGLHLQETWNAYARKVQENKVAILAELHRLKAAGQRVVGYGAPAKGNTLLAYCGIGTDLLAYIVDKSPYKQGLLTPGHHIPVHDPAKLLQDQPDVVFILAWNFAPEIVRQQAEFRNRGGRFMVPIPAPRFVDESVQSHAGAKS